MMLVLYGTEEDPMDSLDSDWDFPSECSIDVGPMPTTPEPSTPLPTTTNRKHTYHSIPPPAEATIQTTMSTKPPSLHYLPSQSAGSDHQFQTFGSLQELKGFQISGQFLVEMGKCGVGFMHLF